MDALIKHQVYKQVVSQAARVSNGTALVQDGYLQADILLASNQSTYKVAVNSSDTNPAQRNDEVRLNQNDAFVITDYRLSLKLEDADKAGQGVPQLYPNATVFAAGVGLVTEDLEAVFNGWLTVKVQDVVYANQIDLSLSRTVRTTQQTSATNKSEKLGLDGYVTMEPVLTLDGSMKNQLAFTFPNWPGIAVQYTDNTTTTKRVYATIDFQGFLITNGSKIGQIGG